MQQSAFTGAGRTHNAYNFPFMNFKACAFKHLEAAIIFFDIRCC